MKYGAGSVFARELLARDNSLCITFRMGSAGFAGAVLVDADFSGGAADKIGAKESCKTMKQEATTRANSRAEEGNLTCKGNLSWSGARRMIVMNYSLPVQRYPKGLANPDEVELFEVDNTRVCPSGPLGAIQAFSKRSRSVNREPLANSTAEICLRPSTLTEIRRNKVAWPQAIRSWVSSRKIVPGAPPVRVRRENGSAEIWQVCPRKEVYAPGQGVKARMRL